MVWEHCTCTCTFLPGTCTCNVVTFFTCSVQVGSGKRDCVTHSLELTRQQKVAVLSRTNFGQFKVRSS